MGNTVYTTGDIDMQGKGLDVDEHSRSTAGQPREDDSVLPPAAWSVYRRPDFAESLHRETRGARGQGLKELRPQRKKAPSKALPGPALAPAPVVCLP